jgi:hypothetical protein
VAGILDTGLVTNLKTVQLMLRHRDIRSTLRYAHAGDRDLLAALESARKSPKAGSEAVVKPLKEKA